jgi:EmrB/QacA subfamily drug resistance transporter
MVGSFLPPLDSGIVNVAVSHIQLDLGGGSDDVAWVSTAYSLGLGLFVPLSTWLSLRLGLTVLHRLALIGFLVGSTLCGAAWDLNSLIAFRVLTAIPGSIVPVVTISMIFQIVPKEKIGAAMGLYGLGVAVAPSIGPTLGGLIVQDLSWRWIFHFKTPIGIAAVIAGTMLLPRLEKARVVPPFDWWGFATFGFGLTGLIVVTAKGTTWHWDSYLIMILATASLLSLALFVVIENEVAHPLIDLRVLRCWPYVNSLLIIGVLLLGVFGTVYYLPQFLQGAQGLDAHDAGMALLPMGVTMAVLVPVAGLLYDRVGPRVPAAIGLCGTVTGALLLATGISVDMTRTEVSVWAAVSVLGGGLGLMPVMTNGLNRLPPTLVGHGGAMNNVMQRVASALGVAAMGVLVTRVNAQLAADRGAVLTPATLMRLPAGADAVESAAVGRPNAMLAGLYEGFLHQVQASAYADMFIALAGISTAGLALALLMRRPPRADS